MSCSPGSAVVIVCVIEVDCIVLLRFLSMSRIARSEQFGDFESPFVFATCSAAYGRHLIISPDGDETASMLRGEMVEGVINLLKKYFAIDVLSSSIHDDAISYVLHPQPHVAKSLSDAEVARRSLIIWITLRKHSADREEPSEKDIERLCRDPDALARYRDRLCSVSWFLRQQQQVIAQRLNRIDKIGGPLFKDRFHSTLCVDELAIDAANAHIELANLISDPSLIQKLINACGVCPPEAENEVPSDIAEVSVDKSLTADVSTETVPDRDFRFGNETQLATNSNTLSWTLSEIIGELKHPVPLQVERLFAAHGITGEVWLILVVHYPRLFSLISGRPETMDAHISRITRRHFYVRPAARSLFKRCTQATS